MLADLAGGAVGKVQELRPEALEPSESHDTLLLLERVVAIREKQMGGSGGSLEPPEPLS